MITKFDSGDKVWVIATVRKAEQVNGKIYYTIDESEYVVPEELCKECSAEDNSTLMEKRSEYQYAAIDDELGYSTVHSRI